MPRPAAAIIPDKQRTLAPPAPAPQRPAATGPRTLRARVFKGAIHIAEPLDLPDGTDIQLDIRILNKP